MPIASASNSDNPTRVKAGEDNFFARNRGLLIFGFMALIIFAVWAAAR